MIRSILFIVAITGMVACTPYPAGSGPMVGRAPSYALGEFGSADLGALRVDALDVRGRLQLALSRLVPSAVAS